MIASKKSRSTPEDIAHDWRKRRYESQAAHSNPGLRERATASPSLSPTSTNVDISPGMEMAAPERMESVRRRTGSPSRSPVSLSNRAMAVRMRSRVSSNKGRYLMAGVALNNSVERMKPSGTWWPYDATCFSPRPLKPSVIWSSTPGLGSCMGETRRSGS